MIVAQQPQAVTSVQPLPPRGWARGYLLACCAVLALLPFVTAPGDIIGDTKLNLAINPAGFLARAMTLWDPQQFGSLQNQATGYLFPMGPFFVLGKLAALPAWVIQRLWIAALLIAAFAGVVRLAGRLGIGTPPARVVAGFAYALSPLALSMLGELSAGFLPMAMLPWILLPLAGAGRDSGVARAAARSALAVALCGGINATSTLGVLLPAGLFILTQSSAAVPRWRLLAWWVPAVTLATFWWTVPLLLLSKYGVSILPYTESASTTTGVTSLSDVLRGTSDWLGYLVTNGQVWWPQGFRIATTVLPTVLTGVIAGLGLSGLVRRGSPPLPERRFLLCSVLAGVIIIAAGHVSGLGNPLAGPIGTFINGPGSAVRNLWKFDPMIRLPVVLGLAHLLAGARLGRWYRALLGTAFAAIAVLAVPAYLSGLAAAGSFSQIPAYWVSAADWLNTHAGHQEVLVEPGAAFGQYIWGSPLDDVLSPLTSADYAERDLGDMGSPGEERLLDTVDEQLSAGAGSAGLTQLLARMGVKYVLVRNDLDRATLSGAWPARISQALTGSPGITRVAAFGPDVGSATPDDAATNFDPPYPAVEIYQVAGALPVATVQSTAGTLRVYGAPEALLTLADENLLGSRPVLLNDDGPSLPVAGSVLTDSLRRLVRNFGEVRGSYSPTLTATEPADTFDATDDYTSPGWDMYESVAKYIGIANVTASSSASDIGASPAQWASGLQPFSAVDGDPLTMWESGSWTGPVGQWIQVSFDSALQLHGSIHAAFYVNYQDWPPVSQVRVSTSAGSVTDVVAAVSSSQPLRVPSGASSWLRITVTGLSSPPLTVSGAQVGISDITIPGVQAARTIVAPPIPGGDPAAVVLAKAEPQPSGCMRTSLRWVCSPDLIAPTEEQYGFDHSFSLPAAEQAQLTGSAIALSPSLIEKHVRTSPRAAQVTASSTYTSDPEDQALSAFDGNSATAWVSSPSDARPALSIRWGYPLTIGQVRIARPPGVRSSWLTVEIAGSGGQLRGAVVGTSGLVRFAPMRTSGLTFTFTTAQAPVQISDVTIPGVPFDRTPPGTVTLPCGKGPRIMVNGTPVPTQATGSYAALVTGQPLQFTACAPVQLGAGDNRVTESASAELAVQNVVLTRGLGGRVAPPQAAGIVSWTASARTLRVDAAVSSYLVVNENFNAGWQAVADGRVLQALRLDGWKQAWLLPAGTSGVVRLTYTPQSVYRVAVIGGLAGAGLVAVVALWPWGIPLSRRRPRWLRRPGPAAMEDPPAGPDDLRNGPAGGAGRRLGRLLVRGVGLLVVLAVLAAAGCWLGGYPGALILPAATAGFLFASDFRGTAAGRLLPGLAEPPALAGLLIAASICGAAGEYLSQDGASGLGVTAAQDTIPQVICLLVIGRLAAALILS
ncbi:MAG TPA: alpha-(1-_3)-arabinofuranosyltransferase family protein [Streptosporangiaceae bacterium]|nr:alpha-(1->3)-arabinofuranosyltransferase family protein [Streptosporangiaceae bacterium]